MAFTGCYDASAFGPGATDLDEIVKVSVDPLELEADGASVATLTIRVPPRGSASEITVSATRGKFLPGADDSATIAVADDSLAVARLEAPAEVGESIVTVTYAGTSRRVTVPVKRAYPETLALDAGRFTLKPGTDASLVATLRRNTGTPTAGLEVTFDAFEVNPQTGANGNRIGRFRSVSLSGSSGTVSATFNLGATDFRGDVRLVATAPMATDGGRVVEGSAIVAVIDP